MASRKQTHTKTAARSDQHAVAVEADVQADVAPVSPRSTRRMSDLGDSVEVSSASDLMHWDNGVPKCGSGGERCIDMHSVVDKIIGDPQLIEQLERPLNRFLKRMKRTFERRVRRMIRDAERASGLKGLEFAMTIRDGRAYLILAQHSEERAMPAAARNGGKHH